MVVLRSIIHPVLTVKNSELIATNVIDPLSSHILLPKDGKAYHLSSFLH